MKTALVLSGGGARGDFEVGAARYLYDKVWPGAHPEIICGTSVGAINAAKLAEGQGGLAGLEGIWQGLHSNQDMYLPEPWFKAISNSGIVNFLQESTFQQGVEVFAALTNPIESVISTFKTAVDINDLKNALEAAAHDKSLYNLGPIAAKLRNVANLDPAKVAGSGITLRLAIVGLESGALRWVTETGQMLNRDGSLRTQSVLAVQCQPLSDQTMELLDEIKDAQDELHTAGTSKGGIIANIQRLSTQYVGTRQALAACVVAHPDVAKPLLMSLPDAVLASASIPGVFQPVQRDDWYVDGGVRSVLPIEAAVLAGAERVFAVIASKVAPDPATSLLGGTPVDIETANFIDIIKHAADDILPNELVHLATDPPRGWGVDVTVIQPMTDIHDGMTIDPGLIDIRMAEGYMRADDTIQSTAAVKIDGWPTPDGLSMARQTQTITALRKTIWEIEGGLDASTLYPVLTPPSLRFLPRVDRIEELRGLKRQLRDAVAQRITAGGAVPAHPEKWWLGWERHQWTPTQALWDSTHPLDPPHKVTVSMQPSSVVLGQPVRAVVHAVDAGTGALVAGQVKVNGVAVALTNSPFLQVFASTTRVRIDPRTHGKVVEDVEPTVSVTVAGHLDQAVACTFTAGGSGVVQISLGSVNYPTRFLRHQNFQAELTGIASDLDKHDGTFTVVAGLAAPALTAGGVGRKTNPTASAVSFEAVNFPGYYLCDQNGRLALARRPAPGSVAFNQSATFRAQSGLAGAGSSSLEAWGGKRYIRHRDFHLYVEDGSTGSATFAQDASFTIAPPLAVVNPVEAPVRSTADSDPSLSVVGPAV